MFFQSPLQSGTLIRRYKRFLADVLLPNNKIITIHCANTGAMTGCATAGDTVWYSRSTNPKRKLPYSWELTYTKDNDHICVNTSKANLIVKEAFFRQQIKEFIPYEQLLSEVKYGTENSRIDLLLQNNQSNMCYVEVKSTTLFDSSNQFGYFPDAVTARGQKHLRELKLMVSEGKRAVIFFLVLHSGIKYFSPATHIDPLYGQLLKDAVKSGVEILCYNTNISTTEITLHQPVPIMLD
ncbi:DNA/RNA nuclease SfsA [Orbus sturtevantii]|uniref:DNA/RNA nuclease SfsA n=1 Tax=Orbus sturtevantii TaxID=3074109 RepID=UPI00370DB396